MIPPFWGIIPIPLYPCTYTYTVHTGYNVPHIYPSRASPNNVDGCYYIYMLEEVWEESLAQLLALQ